MTHQAFRNKWLGQRVDYDHVYAYQCVDLVLQYLYEIHGVGRGVSGNAADYWDKPSSALLNKFDKVSDRTAKQGDIIVHKRSAVNGQAGHIQVADDSTWAIEQNGGLGTGTGLGSDAIRLTKINYSTLLGILRPKGANMGDVINDGDVWLLAAMTGLSQQNIRDLGAVGKTWKEFWYFIIDQQIFKDHGLGAQLADAKKPKPGTVDRASVLAYINEKLS